MSFLADLQSCALTRWSPGIGDPTAMGWVTVTVYLAAAAVAFVVAMRAPFPAASRGRERLFWALLAAVLVALAVNKQLDLQSYLTALGRCADQHQGWYDRRRFVQESVILGLLLVMALLAVGLWRLMRGTLARNGAALAGLVLVLGFVAIRAVGFHHVDTLIKLDVMHLRLNWLLELTGPVLIGLAGLWLLLRWSAKDPDPEKPE
jgi:hypothetical protein